MKLYNTETNEWEDFENLQAVIDMINADRSEDWENYDESDWMEGLYHWTNYENPITSTPKPKLEDSITITWSIDDVREAWENAGNDRSDVTDHDAREILRIIDRDHSADIGINWDVIELATGEYLENKEEKPMTQEIIEVNEEDYDLMATALDAYNRRKEEVDETERGFFLQLAIGRLTWTEYQAREWLKNFIGESEEGNQ